MSLSVHSNLAEETPTSIVLRMGQFDYSQMYRFDDDGQPVDTNGRVLGRLLVKIGDYNIYPPRLMRDIARAARWERYAAARERRYWQNVIWPLVRQIHEAGGMAYAREGSDGNFDVWKTVVLNDDRPGSLTFVHHTIKMPKDPEPLVEVAYAALGSPERDLNRELGEALTRAHMRAGHGDIMRRRHVTRVALHWAMRQLIKRRFGEARPGVGPGLVKIQIRDAGEWLWRRDANGYRWELSASPDIETATITVP